MAHRSMWTILDNDDGDRSVMVPDHEFATIRTAALEVMGQVLGLGEEDHVALALFLTPDNYNLVTWRQHTRKMPEDGYGCCCEEQFWWCEQGTSRPQKFVYWEGSFVYNVEEMLDVQSELRGS